jgi:hypothetical protein
VPNLKNVCQSEGPPILQLASCQTNQDNIATIPDKRTERNYNSAGDEEVVSERRESCKRVFSLVSFAGDTGVPQDEPSVCGGVGVESDIESGLCIALISSLTRDEPSVCRESE